MRVTLKLDLLLLCLLVIHRVDSFRRYQLNFLLGEPLANMTELVRKLKELLVRHHIRIDRLPLGLLYGPL